jgi:putative Mg2+ transporter-C (MgtC) family protein
MMTSHFEMLFRIIVGAVLGGIIGYERSHRGRPLGFRTHVLVGMSSALLMIVSTELVFFEGYADRSAVSIDASRIAASVVLGVGFLAGGGIVRAGPSVIGLTTAAALWLVAAIGLAAGAGMYLESFVVTALGYVALTALQKIERRDEETAEHHAVVVLGDEGPGTKAVIDSLAAIGATVSGLSYERRLAGAKQTIASFDVTLHAARRLDEILVAIESVAGVRSVRVW